MGGSGGAEIRGDGMDGGEGVEFVTLLWELIRLLLCS